MSRFTDLSIGGRLAEFAVKDVDLALINALRRAVIAEVQTAAFCFALDAETNTVDIRRNTSVLHNEFLGHRISLIPVHLSENETRDVAEGRALFEFTLQMKNDGLTPLDVTSGHFKGSLDGVELSEDTLNRMFPVDPLTRDHILIVRLKPQVTTSSSAGGVEEVDVTCRFRMGRGKDHARWTPCSICAFGNVIDEAKAQEALDEEVAKARALNATEEEVNRVIHDFTCMGRHRCYVLNEHGDPAQFLFKLRSECGLRPSYLVFKGLSILSDRVQTLARGMRDARTPDPAVADPVTIEAYGAVPGMFQFTVDDEDHTIGNLVQSMVYNQCIRNDEGKELEYIGYHQPHPLENRITIRVKIIPAVVPDVRPFMARCLERVVTDIRAVIAEWIEFSGLSTAGIREVEHFKAEQSKVEQVEQPPEQPKAKKQLKPVKLTPNVKPVNPEPEVTPNEPVVTAKEPEVNPQNVTAVAQVPKSLPKEPKSVPKEPKEPKKPKSVPKEPKEPKSVPKEPKEPKKPKSVPKEPKEPKSVPKEPKEPKEPKSVPKEPKEPKSVPKEP
ncbi:DNA-directed RNA polymerase II subunit RPB3 [Tetrabaena socialis]|uniref:Plastid-encoded RNA polymerase subunit alpha n=1 Tax=Tetrabaena socialis TaxID=47790 RepID=A0A2J7ZL79_9CHLO|nr:DNA-directed RNA polymerase II subunit RPB3 [Tetrabaena socialis]|eukprot:PNH01024.1 DNA-directed RNA polymerase II subunit RPB3 [Tetrabaena socialis]